MLHLPSKFAFVHRTLWQRNPAYRWAALLGPPPLIGGALAALAVTFCPPLFHGASVGGSVAPWAHWSPPLHHDDQPYAEAATLPLPKPTPTGRWLGFQPGWFGEIVPLSVDAAMDVKVIASPLTSLTFDGPMIELTRILDAGPPGGLFVGSAKTFFVVQKPGLYAFSARLAWAGSQSADCIVRFLSAHHPMVRNVNLNVVGQSVVNYPPTEFRLEPGLLLLQAAVGCWRGDRAMGPGTFTVVVRRPGEVALTPATAGELIQPLPHRADSPR